MARNLTYKEKENLKQVIESQQFTHMEIIKKYGVSSATINRIKRSEGLSQREKVEVSSKPMQRNPRHESFIENCF